jgi:prolyl-tRNA synthetase
MRGVPLRIEIGPRDVAAGQVTIARRDTLEKTAVPRAELAARIPELLADVQKTIYDRALRYREEHTIAADTREALVEGLKSQRGFVKAAWCTRTQCELDIKAETSAVSRVLMGPAPDGATCAFCGSQALAIAYFARSY